MITVTIETAEGPVIRRAKVRAASIARALELAGGELGKARVVFPSEP